MKYLGILLGFVAVVFAGEKIMFKLPEEKIKNIQKFGNQCALENNVDPAVMPKIFDGTLPRDEATTKYLYCFAVKAGVVSEDGHMIVDKMASYLDNHPIVEEYKQALRKCNEVTKENPLATIMEMHRCMLDTAPVHFTL